MLEGFWELKHDFDTFIIDNVVHDARSPHTVFIPTDSDEETDYIQRASIDAAQEDVPPIAEDANGNWPEEELSALLLDDALKHAISEIKRDVGERGQSGRTSAKRSCALGGCARFSHE